MSQSNDKKMREAAQRAMDGAKKRGVKGVRVSIYRARDVSVLYREGRPDKVEESSRKSLSLYLYIDGKYTACKTNDLRDEALGRFLDSSVALCKAMTPDPFRVMPDPSFYEGRENIDLKLFDPNISSVTPEKRHQYASALEQAVLSEAGKKAISVEASYDDTEAEVYQVHSNEGDKKPSGWAVAGARSRSELSDPKEVGKQTVETALARIGASKIETQKLPMIVENRSVGSLLGHLLRAVSGQALQQKSTFLEGKVGEEIGSGVLDITDDPFVPGGFGSRLFDSEGISAKKMPIFDNGVLRNFYIDTYYGKKLDMPPTTGSSSNTVITPGTKSLDKLVAEVNKGILVRGFLGGNSNTATGDFSLGVYGTLIEQGKLTRAVAEMNIAGNHKDFWHRLVAAGNDPYPYSSLRSPSLVFDRVQFSGA
jgi:PmbA protein